MAMSSCLGGPVQGSHSRISKSSASRAAGIASPGGQRRASIAVRASRLQRRDGSGGPCRLPATTDAGSILRASRSRKKSRKCHVGAHLEAEIPAVERFHRVARRRLLAQQLLKAQRLERSCLATAATAATAAAASFDECAHSLKAIESVAGVADAVEDIVEDAARLVQLRFLLQHTHPQRRSAPDVALMLRVCAG